MHLTAVVLFLMAGSEWAPVKPLNKTTITNVPGDPLTTAAQQAPFAALKESGQIGELTRGRYSPNQSNTRGRSQQGRKRS
jgi:hypothetical protein